MQAKTASVGTKLLFGSGSLAFGAKETSFSFFLLVYYNQVLGLEAFWAGLALAIALAIDAVTDLLVGYWSDHLHNRWGRRHPFMYTAAPLVAVSFFLLWNPPQAVLAEQSLLFSYLLACVIVVRTFITMFEVPNAAQGPELTQDYDDRTVLQAYRYGFGWLGGLLLAVLAFFVLFGLDPAGQLGSRGYEWLGVAGAALMFTATYVSAIGTHRHIKHFYKPRRIRTNFGAVTRHILSLFNNQSFNAVFVSSVMFGAAQGLSQALMVYVNTYYWGLTAQQIGFLPLLGVIAVPSAFFIAPWLGRRWGKKAASMRIYLFAIVFLPTIYLAEMAGWFPAATSAFYLPLIMLHFLFESCAIICMQIIFASMSADIVEDRDRNQSGHRDEGLIFAARNFTKKAVSGIGVVLAGLILSLVDFPTAAETTQVTATMTTRLVLAYLPTVIVLYLASWWAIQWFRIDKDTHLLNLQQTTSGSQSSS